MYETDSWERERGREGGRERGREEELQRLLLVLYCHPCTLACEILDIRKIQLERWGVYIHTEMHESRVQGKCIAIPTIFQRKKELP